MKAFFYVCDFWDSHDKKTGKRQLPVLRLKDRSKLAQPSISSVVLKVAQFIKLIKLSYYRDVLNSVACESELKYQKKDNVLKSG